MQQNWQYEASEGGKGIKLNKMLQNTQKMKGNNVEGNLEKEHLKQQGIKKGSRICNMRQQKQQKKQQNRQYEAAEAARRQ